MISGVHLAARSIRVLVVDDFEPFRQFLSITLQNQPDLQIIGEVSDGLEAVQRAEELQPDLILLDIVGIPVKVNIDSGGKPNGVPERL
jgi:chemotaxis response regulator CheB